VTKTTRKWVTHGRRCRRCRHCCRRTTTVHYRTKL